MNSLNGITGITSLISTDSSISIGFSPLNNDINLIASKQGNEGGVTSLNTLTGQNFITSTGGSITISYPYGQYPSGHVINLEAVQGGVVGINTINSIQSDGTHNFTISGAKGNTILSDTNGITVEGPNSVLSINSVTPLGSDIELIGAGTTTITPGPLSNQITISSSGGGGTGVNTINGQSPVSGDIEIVGGNNVQINNTGGNQITVDLYGLSSGILSINNSVPPATDFTLTQGAGITITTLSQGNIEISASGGGGTGINTINMVSPLAGEFAMIAGGTIAITPNANGITIADSGIATINTTAVPDLNHNFEILQGTGITVVTGANGVTIEATGGGGGIASINGSTPATSDFTLTQGNGILITTLSAGDISISQSAAPVTEMNGIFPSAGTIDIVGGGGISVASSGNTITIEATGGGVPGFELGDSGNMTFTSSQTQPGYSNPIADFTNYVSGTSPNQILTFQTELSTTAVSGGNNLTVSDNIIFSLPVGYAPKYNQGGVVSGFNSTAGLPFTCVYTLTTVGLLTFYINTNDTNVPTGDSYYLNGFSLTFPIVPQYYQLLLGTANSQISGLDFPVSQPTSTLNVALTTPAYSGYCS